MDPWLRIAVISVCSVNYMRNGGVPLVSGSINLNDPERCSQHAVVTAHESREAAIKAEADYRAHPRGVDCYGGQGNCVDTWENSFMEWSAKYTRGVYLVHNLRVEQLTFKPKLKKVTKVVEEPAGGEDPVIDALTLRPTDATWIPPSDGYCLTEEDAQNGILEWKPCKTGVPLVPIGGVK